MAHELEIGGRCEPGHSLVLKKSPTPSLELGRRAVGTSVSEAEASRPHRLLVDARTGDRLLGRVGCEQRNATHRARLLSRVMREIEADHFRGEAGIEVPNRGPPWLDANTVAVVVQGVRGARDTSSSPRLPGAPGITTA